MICSDIYDVVYERNPISVSIAATAAIGCQAILRFAIDNYR
jgi:hypothetical protein